jgi:hypothetical protein
VKICKISPESQIYQVDAKQARLRADGKLRGINIDMNTVSLDISPERNTQNHAQNTGT